MSEGSRTLPAPAVDAPSPSSSRVRLALSAILVATGAAALVSEIALARSLSLVLGSTARSAAVTLGVYLLALSAGAAAAARFADRARRPALALAGAWALAAAATALAPWALRLFGEIYAPTSPPTAADGLAVAAVAILAVALPTVFLGASFPLACAAAGLDRSRAAAGVGALAGWNTLGSVAGALVSPALVSGLGLTAALRLAALAFAAAAVAAGAVGAAGRARVESAHDSGERGKGGGEGSRRVGAAVAAGGAATLALEILYARILAVDLGGFSATTAGVIAAFLLGLAVGSMVAPRLAVARARPRAALAAALALAAAVAPATAALLPLVDGVADAVTRALAPEIGSGGAYLAACAAASAMVALPPALGLGSVLPLATAALVSDASADSSTSRTNGAGAIGRLAGRLSFLQSAGGAVGAFVTGYVLLDVLPTKAAVAVVAAVLLAAAVVLVRPGRKLAVALGGGAVAGAAIAALAPWRPLILDSHVFRGRRGGDAELVAASEEALGLVSVVDDRKRGDRRLYTDGFLAAGTGPEYRYMKLLGHLPALLAPRDAVRAGVVCFGSGTTAASIARHPGVSEVEIAEISRRVLDGAPLFSAVNHSVLDDPRVRTVVDDGRRWLRAGGEPFDLVTLEPLLPYTPAAVSLYSAEFSAVVRARLREGGLFCQWIPLHCVEPGDLASLAAAIAVEFPECALFVFEQSAIVIGARGPFALPIAAAMRRGAAREVDEDLEAAGCASALDALAGLVLDAKGVAALAAGAAPLSDDRPSLEARALPRWALTSCFADNVSILLDLAAPSGALADWSGMTAADRDAARKELDRLTRARRSLLRARALMDRWRFREITGDRESAAEALAAARIVLDQALALDPGHPLLAEARRAIE